ncbi:hypothetical protein LH47_00607 [Anoxybacillus thermarum]|uniref:Uncharacterized protein n=2 Tax=Anoxybacillus TaxID=150247 RepID=A0A178TFZ9_9BACL|nr:hypothetical protein AF6_2054 [Anoxybacillus flavithermus TNO-09.006]KIQ95353.1 hypothetical protein LH47_00607 [Anoxybacillus thermarum]OAO80197.1 hypothetical protein A0O32_1536 [Anoxybacillus flavithermus]OAO82892.1 hypothetical protein TAF16_0112 [Anoxybacillus flavithermus]
MGYFSLVAIIIFAFSLFFLLKCAYQLKKNSDIQIKQNEHIIQLLIEQNHKKR